MLNKDSLRAKYVRASFPVINKIREFITGDIPVEAPTLDNPKAKYWTDKVKPSKKEPINQPVEPTATQPTPEVYREPQKIYETNVTITNNYYYGLPQRPSSLLPVEKGEERLNQSPTKVAIGSPIKLAQSITQQNFGQMLFNPFSSQKMVIRQARNDNLVEELTALNETAIEQFIDYQTGEDRTKLSSAVALFMPLELKGLSGQMGVLFGFDTLKYYFSQLTLSSLNALVGVSDIIPNGYEIEEYNPQYTAVPDNLENVILSNGGDLA